MTKKQRHEFYKTLLEVVVNDPIVNIGICMYIRDVIINSNNRKLKNYIYDNGSTYFMMYKLPELYNKAPEKWKEDPHCNYWYPKTSKGWEKRIKAIFDCVNETA